MSARTSSDVDRYWQLNRVRVVAAALAMVLAGSACETKQNHHGVGDVPDSTAGDSAYRAHLRSWRRDSAVLDSVTRQVNTAALYALYRRALGRDGVTLRLMSDIGCEELRIGYHFGPVPSERAIKAMLDTVYHDIGVTDGLDYLAKHAPPEGTLEAGYDVCKPMPSPAPTRIGGTRLDVEYPRPRP